MTAETVAAPAPARRRVSLTTVVGVIAVAVAFAVHFRPWEGGLLEDWGLWQLWDQLEWGGMEALQRSTLGRPLHLLVAFTGLAISNGGFVGYYFMLGLVAALQVLGARWLLGVLGARGIAPWLAALIFALHPWWPAGEILRYMPAQVAMLALVLALGATARWLMGGRWAWLLAAGVATMFGMFTYQALALVQVLLCLVMVVLARRGIRRSVVAVAVSVASIGLAAAYTLIIAQIVPTSYERGLLGSTPALLSGIQAIVGTVFTEAPQVVAALALGAAGTVALAIVRALNPRQTIVIILMLAAAPLTALTYVSSGVHLSDPERVAFPVGVVACAAIASWTVLAHRAERWATSLVAAVAVASLATAVVSVSVWASYSRLQGEALALIEPAMENATADEWLVAEDSSGILGDVYTLYPPYLEIAAQLEFGSVGHIDLCTADDAQRHQPVADGYPIESTPDCSEVLPSDATLVYTRPFHGGDVAIYRLAGAPAN